MTNLQSLSNLRKLKSSLSPKPKVSMTGSRKPSPERNPLTARPAHQKAVAMCGTIPMD